MRLTMINTCPFYDADVTGFLALPDDDDEDDKDGKPKKKKVKKDGLAALKKQKNDPNAPAPNRIPFPDMRDVDKIEKAKVLKEGLRRQGGTSHTQCPCPRFIPLNFGSVLEQILKKFRHSKFATVP